MPSRIGQPNKKLAKLIQELLDLPKLQDATVLLRIVLQTMSTALLRGESVCVRGFGTFKVVERKHRPTPNNILTNDHKGPVVYSPELLYYKPRRVVIFEPSVPFQAMLNPDTPNFEERRAQLRWQR